jgi:hypothetical protein
MNAAALSTIGSKIGFLLDAMPGASVEQNTIIKVFSAAAVVVMPPTVIAAIHGMNFRHLPEQNFEFGYRVAIVVMGAAVRPYGFSGGRSRCKGSSAIVLITCREAAAGERPPR